MPVNVSSYCFGMSFPRGLVPQSPSCSGGIAFERDFIEHSSVFGVRLYAWQLWGLANEAKRGSPEGMGNVQLAWTFVFLEALEQILVMDWLALHLLNTLTAVAGNSTPVDTAGYSLLGAALGLT